MIPFASQRGGGQDLATHLMNAYDNEVAEVVQVRGAIATDLHGAFKEWQAQAEALTRCDKYLYSLSINPDQRQGKLTREQYMDYIARAEDMLGLAGQPRAIVFHEKHGREHCHVVWSRIDALHGKAVHLAFDHEKLMRVTRAFARDHGLRLPAGYEKSRQAGQESLYDREKTRQTGLSKEDHQRAVTQAWQHSDSAPAFVQSLSEQGYLLATGKRPYVLVDLYGGTHALARLIDDKTVKTADLRTFLAKDFPPESLPSVEEALALVERHRTAVERDVSEDERAVALATLKTHHQARRSASAEQRAAVEARERRAAALLASAQRAARDALRHRYLEEREAVTRQREQARPTGLAEFLGRVTGINAVRGLLHKRQDAKALRDYGAQREALKAAQEKESRDLERLHRLAELERTRQEKALLRIERREIVALLRDFRSNQRIVNRGERDGAMPSLDKIARIETRAAPPSRKPARAPDVLDAFESAVTRGPGEPPDLLAAFARAARQHREARSGDDKAPSLDRMTRRGGERSPDSGTGPDRGPDRGPSGSRRGERGR